MQFPARAAQAGIDISMSLKVTKDYPTLPEFDFLTG
jgi:hypothetical protein